MVPDKNWPEVYFIIEEVTEWISEHPEVKDHPQFESLKTAFDSAWLAAKQAQITTDAHLTAIKQARDNLKKLSS